jgi:DNA replication protein DnaC
MQGLERILRKLKEKYPDLDQRLAKGAENARAARSFYKQSVAARMDGDPNQARHFRDLGDDEWAHSLETEPLVVPSRALPGQEASCTQCRDVGWLERRGDLIQCSSCSQFDMEGYRLEHSGIPQARRQQTLESFKPHVHRKALTALTHARAFVDGYAAPWLVLSGPPGCGKTHLARGIALALIAQGWKVKYWPTIYLTTLLHSTQKRDATLDLADVINENANQELLILDDFGVETLTPWVVSQYEGLLDRRWDSLAPTILTSNLPASEIGALSRRISSRMADQSVCLWHDMSGMPDYRRSISPSPTR